MPLTPRLQALSDMVDQGQRVADVGTDHAYVPIALVEEQQIDFAIASDIGAGPLENARNNIESAGLEDRILVRMGPGLSTIEPDDEINTVIIAGMGGKLITQILTDALASGQRFETLILEPNINEPLVRQWLMEHRYHIIAETIVADERHTYEIIKAQVAKKIRQLSPNQLLFGPVLMTEMSPTFRDKWRSRAAYLKVLAANLGMAKESPSNLAKLTEVQQEMQQIEELFSNDRD